MKAWVTKYAFSSGIQEIEGSPWGDEGAFEEDDGWMYARGEWHETRQKAVASAEHTRACRIASLEKQIAKLRRLKFT